MKKFKRPPICAGCPLEGGPGEFVPPKCNCGCGQRLTPSAGCKAAFLVVGIAPGEEEEFRQEPLVGPSGRLLAGAFKWAQVTAPFIKLNLVNCRTLREGRTKVVNRDPTAAEVRACGQRWLRPWIDQFMKNTHGEGHVLALGGLASGGWRSCGSPATPRGRFMRVGGIGSRSIRR
jgi:uracil-DNA glycosylase